MIRKIRLRWDLDQNASPERFFDLGTNDYPEIWRGDTVTVGLTFLTAGVPVLPDIESLSQIVRIHQKVEGSNLHLDQKNSGFGNEAVSLVDWKAGADQVEFEWSDALTAAWSCDDDLRRPLWVLFTLVSPGEDNRQFGGWINLHESSVPPGNGPVPGADIVDLTSRVVSLEETQVAAGNINW